MEARRRKVGRNELEQVDEQDQVSAGEIDGVPESASAEWLA
jgi:hypothetical protein